ncbi:MAG: hypothetical protein QG641_1338 [Candidatus Poribacteria bacterium]|nr:hypothetical protein [Candidatus Poribacteria bacterium]
MDDTISGKLNLNSLVSGILALPKGKASMLMETCIWCLLKCDHPNGVKIQVVDCGKHVCYSIHWPDEEIDKNAVFRSYNKDDAIEHGAEAITFLLIREQTPYTIIRRAVSRTGIDYWLGFKSENSKNLFGKTDARLEVTGILEEKGNNTVKSRIKKKLKQTTPTDNTFRVFVSVVEFSQPYAEMVLKNANS